MKCDIYDRWGTKVNDSTTSLNSANSFISWDGRTSAGLSCGDGVYYYIVTAKGKDDKEYVGEGLCAIDKIRLTRS